MTTYACRRHPDSPVTWRGTGCVDCLAEQSKKLDAQLADRERREQIERGQLIFRRRP